MADNIAHRLLFLLTSLDLGGAEQQVRLLAREFRHRGWTVDVVSMVAIDRPEPLLAAAGVGLFSLGMPRGIPDPRGLLRLVQLLRRRRPAVIHAQMVHANLLAASSRLLERGPAIVTSSRSTHEGSAWRYLAFRATRRFVDNITAVSGSVADELARRHAARREDVTVIPNGIVAEEYASHPEMRRRYRAELAIEDRFAWFAAGRLVPAKALDRMIDAFAAVHAAEPRSILLIAGDGPLEDRLHDQVAKLALSDAVGLLGRRDDVPALMNAADGYIMTSLWEGMPMVLLEAAASGLPAVATNVAGNADVVVHGETGFLVPPRDSGALVNAMVRTMRMPVEERAAAALAARSRIRQHFDLRVVADRWEAAYADAARRHADQRR